MSNLLETIHEAQKLSREVYKSLDPLKKDYHLFLLTYNPIGYVPSFRLPCEQMPAYHYDMSLLSNDDENLYFSGEYCEIVYFFRMPFEYIADPAGWLEKHIAEQETLKATRGVITQNCDTYGCSCAGDLEKHFEY